jgi:N-acetylglutamate synthase-like GNAT family acetyltransferase
MTSNTMDDGVNVSCDPSLLDETFVYHYLHEHMYWAKSLTFDAFQRSLENSAVVAGVYDHRAGGMQIGFARVISDCATFAYLTDVFIVDRYREQGLSKRLLQAVMDHPQLQGLRRFMLVTEDAAGLYRKFGFQPLTHADHWMEIFQAK